MTQKRLTKRIENLSYAIGKAEPHPGFFKGELVNIHALVQELENGAAVSEAQEQVAALQATLEQANSQNAILEAHLQEVNAEVERFRKERKQQEEREEKVMQALATLGPMSCNDFYGEDGVTADGAEVALHDLDQSDFVKITKPATATNEATYDLALEGVRYLLERGYLS